MTQPLRLGEVLRCALFGAPMRPNLACPWETITNDSPLRNSVLWKETLANRKGRVTLAWWDGGRPEGLASARVRSGPTAWEIDRFFLAHGTGAGGNGPRPSPDTVALDLFEQMAEAAGNHRCQRVFLRLPVKSLIHLQARQAGFFPYFEETLLERPASRPRGAASIAPGEVAADWLEQLPEDSHGLFQLYCAATPHEVRAAAGLTFDQWRDAQETRGARKGWVLRRNGRIVGWTASSEFDGVTVGEALADPNDEDTWQSLASRSAGRLGAQRWLVPDYHQELTGRLLRMGFRELGRYSVMIKTVAVPVASHSMATVEA